MAWVHPVVSFPLNITYIRWILALHRDTRPTDPEPLGRYFRHFAQWEVDEEKVLESWITHMNTDRDVRELDAVKK